MATSFFIAWVIFSPFAVIEDLHDWSIAKMETSDLFAIFLPCSVLLALLKWVSPADNLSTLTWALIASTILVISVHGLATGLFLLAKMNRKPPIKRMAIIGVIVPFGSLLTLAWILIPVFAFANSMFYAIPATTAIAPITLSLRWLSSWVCRGDP